jgi:hypothetical protein
LSIGAASIALPARDDLSAEPPGGLKPAMSAAAADPRCGASPGARRNDLFHRTLIPPTGKTLPARRNILAGIFLPACENANAFFGNACGFPLTSAKFHGIFEA